MEIPLRLGPLKADGYEIQCSGARYLCESGQMCAANQPVAFFNLTFVPALGQGKTVIPFSEEQELQVVVAPRVAGRVKFDSKSSSGGHLSVLRVGLWDENTVLGRLEVEGTPADNAGELRKLMLAGRRMTPLVDVHAGLLPGWNGRSRGWWAEEGETPVTMLSLGICDITGVVTGEESAFIEMFKTETAATHFVFIPDHPIAPAAPVLLDQFERTSTNFRAIANDLLVSLAKFNSPTANDMMFAGTLLSVLEQCPIRDTYDIVSASGVIRSEPANAILMSLHSEPPVILRHKTLGYRVHFLKHHLAAAGPAINNWLKQSFQPVKRTTADIKTDYEKLADAVEKSNGAQLLIINRMSTSGDENISSYSPFDAPLSDTLASVAAKEVNLMLHDVAANRNVSIIDLDAIAADIGGGRHLPDGIHQSSELQQLLRAEILHALSAFRPEKTLA